MNRFDYILFDLDGTLLDTSNGVLSAAVCTIQKYNREVPEPAVLESLIGPPIQSSFRRLYGLSEPEAMEMADTFRKIYMTDGFLLRAIPYKGIYRLFQELLDMKANIGIATYKREDYAKRLLLKKGFGQYTDFIYGSDYAGKLKKTDIIRMCLRDMGCIDLSRAVYIGDGTSDGIGAGEAGISFIGVTYGFGFKTARDAEIFSPIAVANSCDELKKILLTEGAF